MAEIRWSAEGMQATGIAFDPRLTLIDSAQVFHWRENENVFSATVSGKSVRLIPNENGFILLGARRADEALWKRYFDLERDYERIPNEISGYPAAQKAMKLLPGLRVLNQPPWEALLSFILSANNNVHRIRQLVERLIDTFGENGGFPSADRLSRVKEAEIRAIGCGYRAPYLVQTSCMVRDGFPLETLSELPYDEAHQMLLRLPGVGDKVADCVQLFGMGYSEAFPVDVWVERLMKKWFALEAHGRREVSRKARAMFGKQAGIVQQSMFHCARIGLISLDE